MKKNQFKHIVKKNIKQEVSPNFANNVMFQIESDLYLKTHLKQALLQKTPDGFTSSVLNKLIPKTTPPVYQPVISRNVWLVLSVIFVFVLSLGMNTSDSTKATKYIDLAIANFNSKFNLFVNYLISNSFIMLIFVSVSGLIVMDMLLKSNKISIKKAS